MTRRKTPDVRQLDNIITEAGIMADEARAALGDRDRLILEAIDAGATFAAVARATGLSYQGISKMARRRHA